MCLCEARASVQSMLARSRVCVKMRHTHLSNYYIWKCDINTKEVASESDLGSIRAKLQRHAHQAYDEVLAVLPRKDS